MDRMLLSWPRYHCKWTLVQYAVSSSTQVTRTLLWCTHAHDIQCHQCRMSCDLHSPPPKSVQDFQSPSHQKRSMRFAGKHPRWWLKCIGGSLLTTRSGSCQFSVTVKFGDDNSGQQSSLQTLKGTLKIKLPVSMGRPRPSHLIQRHLYKGSHIPRSLFHPHF